MITYRIRGKVVEAETGIGIPGLFIKAYDKDMLFDDLLGSTYTKTAGRFEIITEPEDFRDFFDIKPDIYLRIYAPDAETLIHTTEDAIRWQAGRIEEFDVQIPRKNLRDLAPKRILRLLNERGVEINDFEAGESLMVAVEGVQPKTAYNLVILDEEGQELFSNRLISNTKGTVAISNIWPYIGLENPRSGKAMSPEQALKQWTGKKLKLELRKDKEVVMEETIKIAEVLNKPLVLSTDSKGVVLSGFELGRQDAIVSVYNAPFEGLARIYMVPRQYNWHAGDSFTPVLLRSGRTAHVDINIDESHHFRAHIAEARELHPGAYDFIVRQLRYGYEDDEDFELRSNDLVTRTVTGLVVRQDFMASKAVLGGCVNVLPMSGRYISGVPYFRYANTFQVGEDVYAALDPAALDPNLLGKMVALYVIQHKSDSEWNADTSLNHLPELGGNPAVPRLKTQPGCINYDRMLIWPNASTIGEYDIVADFGNNTPDASAFVPDNNLDSPLDIIDGYFITGFRIVPDPAVDTSFDYAGTFEYFLSGESIAVIGDYGLQWTVDNKAVVYFPADSPGATGPSQISTEQASYPLVVIVHGNSSSTNSYQGYNYLLEHLAKNGFIAASIHLEPGMRGTGRARVLFEHIDTLKAQFDARIANNIGIMGHSRGGEAVVIAARLIHQEGLVHNLNAIISLAPTDMFTHEILGGDWATPYLVVYGSMDGDVAGGPPPPMNTGFALYDRTIDADKCMVFVYGSTHGRYNTVWGDTDITASWSSLGPNDMSELISADAHKRIAKGYMTAFFRRYLKNELQWDGVFRGEWIPASVEQADSGAVKLYIQYEDTDKTEVDNFEGSHTATSWQDSTIGGDVDDDDSLPNDPVEDELYNQDDHSPHETGGLLLQWNDLTDHITFEIPGAKSNVKNFDSLSFRITQKVGSPDSDQMQDLYVTFKDTGGRQRSIKVSKFGEVPPPHPRHFSVYTKSAMCTIRIPLHVFTIRVAGADIVNLESIERVTFDFKAKPSGEIEIDSIEFTK